jgi:hypothetical protein
MYDSELFPKPDSSYTQRQGFGPRPLAFHFEGADSLKYSPLFTAIRTRMRRRLGFGSRCMEPELKSAYKPARQPRFLTKQPFQTHSINHPRHPRIFESGSSFDGSFWFKAIPSTNDHPHAPWWACTDNSPAMETTIQQAALAGFLFRHCKGKCTEGTTGNPHCQRSIRPIAGRRQGERLSHYHLLSQDA